MSAKIEKGVPLPDRWGVAPPEDALMVRDMEVGDSMIVTGNRTLRACYHQARKHGMTVTYRKATTTPGDGIDTLYRIWRIA